tara:strand:+ start:1863 stop:2294 length:432 start_codon:yes stop_codon:yes gene_type:complete
MGFLLVFFTTIVVGAAMFVLGPILYYLVSKKVVGFNNAVLKKYVIFWLAWLLINAILSAFLSAIYGVNYEGEDIASSLANYSNISFIIGFGVLTVLAKWIFQESYWRAFKAALIYTILASIVFAVLAMAVLFLGLDLLVGSTK